MSIQPGFLRLWTLAAVVWTMGASVVLRRDTDPIWHWPTYRFDKPQTMADLIWLEKWGHWSEADVVSQLASATGMDAKGARNEGYSDAEIGDYILAHQHPPDEPTLYRSLLWLNTGRLAGWLIVPPLILLLFGWGTIWVVAGFTKPRHTEARP